MKAVDLVLLLGKSSDDERIVALLVAYGIKRKPKLLSGDESSILVNRQLGVEITFGDAEFLAPYLKLDESDYEEGEMLLWNVRYYNSGADRSYRRFEGALPFDITFDMKRAEVLAQMGAKPAGENKQFRRIVWEFKGYSLYVDFMRDNNRIRTIELNVS